MLRGPAPSHRTTVEAPLRSDLICAVVSIAAAFSLRDAPLPFH